MKKLLITFIALILMIYGAYAQKTVGKRKAHFLISSGVAIQGYDPVSYFKGKSPKKGKSSLKYTHQGVTYYFASKENLSAFKSAPQKYEPAYGGWCAYAIVEGKKVKPDPNTFKIEDGSLLLFYKTFFTNTLNLWEENPKTYHKKAADKKWEVMVKK